MSENVPVDAAGNNEYEDYEYDDDEYVCDDECEGGGNLNSGSCSPSVMQAFEDGEEDDNEKDESSPTTKRLKSIEDEYERVITKQSTTILRLEAENKDLKENALHEILNIQKSQQLLIEAFAGYAGVSISSISGSSFAIQPTKIEQVFNVNEQIGCDCSSIDHIDAPVRFSGSGSFPHAIVNINNMRQLQVENRRPVTLTFALVSKLCEMKVTEKNIREDGLLPFKMSILYADNHDEVTKDDFTKTTVSDMCDPRYEIIRKKHMRNGKLVFMFKFNITSCDTTPKGRAFVVKVAPDVVSLENNVDLTMVTPPFVVRSKVTAGKSK